MSTGPSLAREPWLPLQMLEHVSAAVIATDVDGTVVYWNRHAELLYGWSRDEALGRSIVGLTVGPVEAEVGQAIMAQLRQGRKWEGEFLTSRKDGTVFPAYVVDAPIRNPDGRIVGVVGVSVDLTERKRLEGQLRHQLELTLAVAGSLAEGLYTVDAQGRLTFMNSAAEQLLGWQHAELLGKSMHDAVHYRTPDGGYVTQDQCPLMQVRVSGSVYRSEDDVFVRKDGTTLPVAYISSPIIMNAEIVGAVVAFRDISDVLELRRMRDEYLSLVSHDLRTPLTAVLGHAQWLARGLEQKGLEREAQSASLILRAGRQMNTMIGDLLETASLEAGTMEMQLQDLDLGAFISTLGDHLPPEGQARVRLHVRSPVHARADAERLERAVMNLLTNALKYSPPEEPVDVTVQRDGENVRIDVADRGRGIPESDVPRIFNRYYRSAGSTGAEGLGLGLHIARLIIEALGGSIEVRSKLGAGSTFSVVLPVLDPHGG